MEEKERYCEPGWIPDKDHKDGLYLPFKASRSVPLAAHRGRPDGAFDAWMIRRVGRQIQSQTITQSPA